MKTLLAPGLASNSAEPRDLLYSAWAREISAAASLSLDDRLCAPINFRTDRAFSIEVRGSGDAITVVALERNDSEDMRTREEVGALSRSDTSSAWGDDVRDGDEILSLPRVNDLLRRGFCARDRTSICSYTVARIDPSDEFASLHTNAKSR